MYVLGECIMSLGLKKVQKVKPQSYHVAHNLESVTFRHKTRSRHLTMLCVCLLVGGWQLGSSLQYFVMCPNLWLYIWLILFNFEGAHGLPIFSPNYCSLSESIFFIRLGKEAKMFLGLYIRFKSTLRLVVEPFRRIGQFDTSNQFMGNFKDFKIAPISCLQFPSPFHLPYCVL